MAGKSGSRYYRIWRGDTGRTDYPTAEQFLDKLDPFRNHSCSICGGAKSLGMVTCEGCSRICPDQDCAGDPNGVKLPGQDMCSHCEDWCDGLDVRGEGGNLFQLEREGFFVYLLEKDEDNKDEYVGMTHNPSRRQFDHWEGARVRREMRERNVRRPDAYYERAWDNHCRELWSKNRRGTRRIKWLSPLLNARDEAYRCEWALRYYRDRHLDEFREVLSMSSTPELLLLSAEVRYDSLEEKLLFKLSLVSQVRGLPHGLYKEQIIGPPLFDFEYRPEETPEGPYCGVTRKSEPVLKDYSEPGFLGSWRARAVLDDVVGCPWTYVEVPWLSIGLGIQDLVGVHDAVATPVGHREMRVEWSVANSILGLRYLVERTELTPDLKASASAPVPFICDCSTLVDSSVTYNQGKTPYIYAVRAFLGGTRGTRVFKRAYF